MKTTFAFTIFAFVCAFALTANAQNLTGLYTGDILNTTRNISGKLSLEIRKADADGNVVAYFSASQGLTGDCELRGTIDESGGLNLKGTISANPITVKGFIGNGTIKASYEIGDVWTEGGNFTVYRQGGNSRENNDDGNPKSNPNQNRQTRRSVSYEAKPGDFNVGDEVEVDYASGWYKGVILAVKYEGTAYDIELAPPDGGNSFKWSTSHKNVRPLSAETSAKYRQPTSGGGLVYGKYGCTSTTGAAYNGTYQIHPRGSFVITSGGKYTYYGFENPSSGTFSVDGDGAMDFKNGAFDGGKATPLGAGYPNQFFLVYPTITENRWKCKLVE